MDQQRLEDIARRHGSAGASVIDPALVRRKALLITRDLADLAPLAQMPFASFVQLASIGVYDAAFGRHVTACSGLRNRIVDGYDDIDPKRVHEAVRAAGGDVAAT